MIAADSSTPEAALLAAVVAQAVRDACLKPSKPSARGTPAKPQADARTAILFLFGRDSGLDGYAHWLDFDAHMFRKRLMARMSADDSDARFSDDARRAFRFNYRCVMGAEA